MYLIVTKNDCPDCDSLKRQIENVKLLNVDWLNADEEPTKFKELMSKINTAPRGVPFLVKLGDVIELKAIKAQPIIEVLFESN